MSTTKWVKGQSGNPRGRPALPKSVRDLHQTSYQEALEHLHIYMDKNTPEIQEILESPQSTMKELIFARFISDAANGVKDARNVLFDRLWGKVKTEISVEAKTALKEEYQGLSDKELIKIATGVA